MKLKIFSIYDSKAQGYISPWCVPSTAFAVRIFSDDCNNPESAFWMHPEDYTLFELGSFDVETGNIEKQATPLAVVKAIDLIDPEKERLLKRIMELEEEKEKRRIEQNERMRKHREKKKEVSK